MGKVSVEKKAVLGAISLCEYSIECFQMAAKRLTQDYVAAGEMWKDSKYMQLGQMIEQCDQALRGPITELEDCMEKLRQMSHILEEYERLEL